MEQLTLTIILESCAAGDKVDATGSPVPFARELASYLAHCAVRSCSRRWLLRTICSSCCKAQAADGAACSLSCVFKHTLQLQPAAEMSSRGHCRSIVSSCAPGAALR